MMERFETLNVEQEQAVEHFEGPCLVLAGPGTGKTTIIINRIINLIKNYYVEPHNILVITFTRSAAKEMESRFRRLEDYSSKYNQVSFGTFHSVFFKILQHFKNYKIENLINENDRNMLIKAIAKNNKVDFFEDEEALENIINEISYIKYKLKDKKNYAAKSCGNEVFWNIYEKYEKYKMKQNKFDFDDMITHCYDLLKNNNKVLNEVRIRYKFILIDEFQDINKSQFETISLIASPLNNIFVVGDDDQSIYRFRGSDPGTMKKFIKAFKNIKIITLKDNYRNNKTILYSAKNVIKNNSDRYKKCLISTRDCGNSPWVIEVEDAAAEAKSISEKIKELVAEGLCYSDIAVIYRTKIQSASTIDCFINDRIPFVCLEGLSYLHNHWIYKDVISYLKASVNTDRNNSIYRIINKPYRYIEKRTISPSINHKGDLLEYLINSKELSRRQKNYLKKLIKDLNCIGKMKMDEIVYYIKKGIGYEEYIKDFANSKNINTKPLMEILDDINNSIRSFDSLLGYLNHIDLVLKRSKSQINNSVKIMTMHKAKGLEFKAVFIIDAIEGLIPGMSCEKTEPDVSELEEERRLFYVAITRAADELYIYVPKYRYGKRVKPSRFLSEIYE